MDFMDYVAFAQALFVCISTVALLLAIVANVVFELLRCRMRREKKLADNLSANHSLGESDG